MKLSLTVAAAGFLASAIAMNLALADAAEHTSPAAKKVLARGKYLVEIAGCNDCHTARYPETAGKVPEKEWLTGDALGWRGPWGTTYATNLRRFLPSMSQEQWVKHARTMEPRPPMPWFNVRAMSDQDLVAIYRYVNSLGPAGDFAPAYVEPGKVPSGPYVQFPQ